MKLNDFNELYVLNSVPVLVKNDNAEHSPAYEKWTFDFFRDNYGNIEIELSDDPFKRGIVTQKKTISEYLELLEVDNNNCPYHVGWPYEKFAPELNADVKLPSFSPSDFIDSLPQKMQFRRRWIFFGKGGLSSDLHVDCFSSNGWLYMIDGIKTIRCVSPLFEEFLETHDSLFDDVVVSKVESNGGEVMEFQLTPGNVFYIPSGWSHHVRNDTNTIMVTQNFTMGLDTLRFYRNYRKLISKDVDACDQVYTNYIFNIPYVKKLSNEKLALIDRELKLLEAEASNIESMRLFLLKLKSNA